MPENTTHDWSASVDVGHLDAIGRDPATYAPGGATHLLLEVLAYAAEEAAGRPIRKPVMATKDLRFFDTPSEILPDGFPRRGMSVVAALSDWLVHTNRRVEGSWTPRYERGRPVTDLTPIDPDGTTGTTVRFRPVAELRPAEPSPGAWEHLTVELGP